MKKSTKVYNNKPVRFTFGELLSTVLMTIAITLIGWCWLVLLLLPKI